MFSKEQLDKIVPPHVVTPEKRVATIKDGDLVCLACGATLEPNELEGTDDEKCPKCGEPLLVTDDEEPTVDRNAIYRAALTARREARRAAYLLRDKIDKLLRKHRAEMNGNEPTERRTGFGNFSGIVVTKKD